MPILASAKIGCEFGHKWALSDSLEEKKKKKHKPLGYGPSVPVTFTQIVKNHFSIKTLYFESHKVVFG